ncbi:class I SAM-dependent DNA methyltransferase, partial [Eubacterium sp.]|uniref:class I SAM-dependent DNA methyltransferase n=1 Tax=Eubacterium sp. TaxID=142586 RepID=UPI0040284BF2
GALSEPRPEIATQPLCQCGCEFSLLKAKMCDFALPESVDAAVCSLDSINHLNSSDDVKKAFSCVYNSLKENSIFVFDVNTIYKHNQILSDDTFIFDEDDYYIVWDNEHIDDRNVRILIDMFIFNGSSYDRRSEEFIETAYEIDELKKMLYDSGFSSVEVYDELTENKPRSDSERLYFVCKKD